MDQEKDLTEKTKSYKGLMFTFITIAIILACLLILSLFFVRNIEIDRRDAVTQRNEMKLELDSMLIEYEDVKVVYGELNNQQAEKDSLIFVQAQEIYKLIESKADTKAIERELNLLRKQRKEYLRVIDSLSMANQKLTIENEEIRKENTRLIQEKNQQQQMKKETKKEEKDSEPVAKKETSNLKTSDVRLIGIMLKSKNKKEVETDLAKRTSRFKINFVLNEIKPTTPKEINLYCQIVLSDGRVITSALDESQSFENQGKTMYYTVKKTVYFRNKALNVEMFWDLIDGDKAIPGSYTVKVFSDTHLIGESTLILN